jgi:ankyrin repeat protein
MIDAVDDKGQTPLHIAARVRNIPFMNALFECGCDPDISDKDGKTARQYLPGFNAAADVPIIAGQKLRGDIT